jgi:hypothetical protein
MGGICLGAAAVTTTIDFGSAEGSICPGVILADYFPDLLPRMLGVQGTSIEDSRIRREINPNW